MLLNLHNRRGGTTMRSSRFWSSPLPMALYLLLLLLGSLTAGGAPKPGNVYRVLADAEGDVVWVMPVVTPAIKMVVKAGDARMLTKGMVLVNCPAKNFEYTIQQGSTQYKVYQTVLECKDGLRLSLAGVVLE